MAICSEADLLTAGTLPSNDAADGGIDRCIFCHAASGQQYVPMHFAGTVEESESESLPYSESFQAHCACAGCWQSWEEKQYHQRRPVLCPVCQRRVDVFQGYFSDASL